MVQVSKHKQWAWPDISSNIAYLQPNSVLWEPMAVRLWKHWCLWRLSKLSWLIISGLQEERESFGKSLQALELTDCYRKQFPDHVGRLSLFTDPYVIYSFFRQSPLLLLIRLVVIVVSLCLSKNWLSTMLGEAGDPFANFENPHK